MVMLLEVDIHTKEVLEWQGVHLFHFQRSSCSQKLRIFLRLKDIKWHSHHLNLARKEHLTPHYMGINPRGLVPTLVHDGKVIIESNDILEYLEDQFPEPVLIPNDKANQVRAMLQAEDDLHLDIRALTMRFVFPSFISKRPEAELKKYESFGTGTVGGDIDPHRAIELKFWRDILEYGGVTDGQTKAAYDAFKKQLDEFDRLLVGQAYLLGGKVSLVDIAWYIYCRRLIDASYPLNRFHPNIARWFKLLDTDPIFHAEVPSGGLLGGVTSVLHFVQKLRGSDLQNVAVE
jgi:glutathione S-transferase